jgi:hypothetical protein
MYELRQTTKSRSRAPCNAHATLRRVRSRIESERVARVDQHAPPCTRATRPPARNRPSPRSCIPEKHQSRSRYRVPCSAAVTCDWRRGLSERADQPWDFSNPAGVRRRFAPHQLRHAHAVEMAREGVPLIVIQPRHHLDLRTGHRQHRDHRHRPRPPRPDDPRPQLAEPLNATGGGELVSSPPVLFTASSQPVGVRSQPALFPSRGSEVRTP